MHETYKTFSDWFVGCKEDYDRVVKEIERRSEEDNRLMTERYFSIDRENLCNYNWSGTKHDMSIYDYIESNCKLRDAKELIIYVFDSEKRAVKFRTISDYTTLYSIKERNINAYPEFTTAICKKIKNINAYRINDGYYMIIGSTYSEEEINKELKTQWVNKYCAQLREYRIGVTKYIFAPERVDVAFKANIKRSGNKIVVAVAKQKFVDGGSNTDITIGISRCSNKDIFDYDTGAAIAFARAIGDTIPDYVLKY